MAFHNGSPVEWLYLIARTDGGEEWMVKPLFVSQPVSHSVFYREDDRLTLLHSQSH